MITPLLISVVFLALIFDFINGFHDAANSIATIVTTKVLTPLQAVFWAAAFNFLAYFVIKDHQVANTVAKTVGKEFITMHVVLAGLIAAIAWNLVTWWRGIPSSSSHTLMGGFAGAGMAHAALTGFHAIDAVNLHAISMIVLYIVVAPILGLAMSYALTLLFAKLARYFKPSTVRRWSKGAQLVSSGALSFAHGGNDAQKVMGIIYVALVASNIISDDAHMPDWIPLACYSAISLGTLSGGWKIVETIGKKITRITPLKGVGAETAGAMTLLMTERLGVPVSTTHTITGAVIGVGLTDGIAKVRWDIIRNLIVAWIITIPISALLAAATYAVIFAVRP